MILRNVAKLLLLSTGAALAIEMPTERLMDSPGPGYDRMREQLEDQTGQARPYRMSPSLRLEPEDILSASRFSIENGVSQIQIKVRPKAAEDVGKEIESYQGYPLRLELGDYILPIDFTKTLPWTGVIWLEARPDRKNSAILGTLTDEK